MTRLTEKDTQSFSYNIDDDISSDLTGGYDLRGESNICFVIEKLGQLEDIEDELGIDLIKLLNAEKVYYMTRKSAFGKLEIDEAHELIINLSRRTIEYYEDEYDDFTCELNIKNYGKNNVCDGRAFTREELEK